MWGSWIPPVPLALGALFGLVAWILAIAYGIEPSFARGLAWIHAVALGSITTIALSVLIHVIPGFTDLEWRFRTVARWCAFFLPFAAAGLVVAFFAMNLPGIAGFGTVAAVIVIVYAVVAILTLAQRAPTPVEGAIARGFLYVITFLGFAALIGGGVAHGMLSGDARILRFAPVHATLAIVGWLTMLTMGVSARTFRPMMRADSRWRPLHIVSNSSMFFCAIITAIGFGTEVTALTAAGFALGLVGAAIYAFDGFDRVRRAATPNRPAHAFVASAFVWLVVAAIAAVLGNYPLATVVALAGWLGQMVNAHLHHLGIRVIATTFGGEENETRPWQMMDMRVAWTSVALDQIAVLALALGVLLPSPSLIVAGGIVGLAGMLAFLLNVRIAMQRVTPGLI